MVNFRFHLVSLIAVFLALGLGILTGSAVVNQATVRTIRAEIKDVRNEVNSLRGENGRLGDELGRTNAFMADAATFAVDGRLTDVPVAVVAERGVNGDAVNDTLTLVRAAGAVAPVVVWLEDKWKLESEQDVQALRDATGLLGGANSVRERALDQLAERLTATATSRSTTDAPPDLLKRLSDAGFIGIDGDQAALATYPPTAARALAITGTNSTFAGSDFTTQVVRSLIGAGAPSVLGEVFVQHDGKDAAQRGDAVAAIRSDKTMSTMVSTVDDLDLVQGRVAGVLALQDLGDGTVGHYGYGRGADASLPAPRQSEQQ